MLALNIIIFVVFANLVQELHIPGFSHVLIMATALFYVKIQNLDQSIYKLIYCIMLLAVYLIMMSFIGYSPGLVFSIIATSMLLLPYIVLTCGLTSAINIDILCNILKKSAITIFVLACFDYILFLFSAVSDIRVYAITDHFLFFTELSRFSSLLVYCLIILLGVSLIKKSNSYILISGLLTIVLTSLTIKKTIIIAVIVWLYYFYAKRSFTRKSGLITIVLFLCIITTGLFVNYSYFNEDMIKNVNYLQDAGPSGHVRVGMYVAAISLFTEKFPLGTGPGTFGSLISVIKYSPIYYDNGINLIGVNSEEDVDRGVHTLLDTFWPHIVAECGFIGMLLYLMLFISPIYVLYITRKQSDYYSPFINYYVTLSTLLVFVEGFLLYTPEMPIFILFHNLISGMLLSYKLRKYKINIVRVDCRQA